MSSGTAWGLQTMSRASAWALVALGAVIMLAPFYMMFVFATHPREEIFQVPPPLWFGTDFMGNMGILLKRIPFWTNLAWSFYVAIAFTLCSLLFCSMGGYAFAIYEFPLKKQLFGLVMGTMLIPPFLGMIPNFMVMDFLGWIDRPIALYLPGAAGAFGIFMVRQYVLSSVPRELIEAARMDGSGKTMGQ